MGLGLIDRQVSGWRFLQSQAFSLLRPFAILLDPEGEYRINAGRKRSTDLEAEGIKLFRRGDPDACSVAHLLCDVLWNLLIPRAGVEDSTEALARES